MDPITFCDRWLAAGWKEQQTGFTLYRQLQKLCSSSTDYLVIKDITRRMQLVNGYIRRIQEATRSTNPSVRRSGDPVLPCVAWLPLPVMDDETGLSSIPPQPQVPQGLDKAQLCMWKKEQADMALQEPAVEQPAPEEQPSSTQHPTPTQEDTQEAEQPFRYRRRSKRNA